MKYWSSSALVPLCVDEAVTERMIGFYRADPVVLTLQLASAVIASDREPATLEIVTLDTRLAAAARREGFAVISG